MLRVQISPVSPDLVRKKCFFTRLFEPWFVFIFVNKNSEYKLRFKRRKKEQAIKIFGGKCQICGYDKCMGALDFHHLDPSKKDENIGRAIIQWKWERVKPELDKCILLCSNCHREIHYKQVDSHELLNLYKPWIKIICPVCKNEFDTKNEGQIYCSSSCLSFSQRRTVRPSKEELKKLVDDKSIAWTKMGEMFGVSDNAVRKWSRQYGLI
jgi:transcription elongation factor Elf1